MKAADIPMPVRVTVTSVLAAATLAYALWAFAPAKSEEKKPEKKP